MSNYKKYEELTISDDFMFCKVMESRPDLCEEFVSVLLGRTVRITSDIEKQKTVEIIDEGRGIRMDIYFEGDDQAVYNLEMQNANYHDLPLRSRYYQSLIDVDILERGQIFLDLKASYVIFLCRFDPFDHGLCRYTFRQTCEELPELPLEDKAFRIFLNTKAAAHAASPELCALLDYVDGREATTDFTQRLDHYVKAARSKEDWKVIYLKQHSREETIRREAEKRGEKRGEERGEKRGIAIGEKRGGDRRASDIARKMKSSGMPATQITEFTGLTTEQIEAL